MSQGKQQQLTTALTKLGMSSYQAKVYTALASLGPAGVAEIQRVSTVPRTKIYEILQQLLDMGAVEFQSGRPTIYNALSPNVLVDRMRNSFLNAADQATRLLTEIRQIDNDENEAMAWTVKGNIAVNQKAMLTIASAKEKLVMVEPYPPRLIKNATSIIRAQQKKIKTRVLCVLREDQHLEDKFKEDFIEYRKVTKRFLGEEIPGFIGEFKEPILAIMSHAAGLIIIDDNEALLCFPDKKDPTQKMGLNLKIPGLPGMQRIMFESIIQHTTIRL
jgi:sugar-specific transcriptional regulator TrmB